MINETYILAAVLSQAGKRHCSPRQNKVKERQSGRRSVVSCSLRSHGL